METGKKNYSTPTAVWFRTSLDSGILTGSPDGGSIEQTTEEELEIN